MKIGIACYPTFGGSGAVATALGHAIAARGHEAHFLSYAFPVKLSRTRAKIYFHKIEVSNYPLHLYPPYTTALAAKMLQLESRVDIFHMHYGFPHAIAAYLYHMASTCSRPYLVTLHGTDITRESVDGFNVPLINLGLKHAAAITTVSKYLKEATKKTLCRNYNIDVIYNFLEESLFCPEGDSECGLKTPMPRLPKEIKVITHISNFRPVKRIGDVVDIFYRISRKVPSVLIMAGDGPEIPLARRLTKKYGIENQVYFLGSSRCVKAILKKSHLFLMPSAGESFGLAALEAMSLGVPVIGTNAGGLPEVVEHGKHGFLYKIGDVKSMSGSGIKLLSDPELYKVFSRSA
ncbi:MAG: N-acetyl-alpha-D-glucosaminyl L-malate synthase BshA, partial [bacterium]